MAKRTGIIGYLITGVKLWIVGLISGIILFIPLLILGFAAMSSISLVSGGAGLSTIAASGSLYAVYLGLNILVSGFIAQKLWKWA